VQHLQGNATSTIFRDSATEESIPERAELRETIIEDLLRGKRVYKAQMALYFSREVNPAD
jgi:hypothetical protein